MRLKIRCDGESEKFYKIFWELNKASGVRIEGVTILFRPNPEHKQKPLYVHYRPSPPSISSPAPSLPSLPRSGSRRQNPRSLSLLNPQQGNVSCPKIGALAVDLSSPRFVDWFGAFHPTNFVVIIGSCLCYSAEGCRSRPR